MESPVVLEKPPEYHGKSDERGFPFDEEESGAWSSLAARHPDIAARLRQRPATWARKRRPSSQDATDGYITKKRFMFPDFGDNFGFDRFPFDDIPPEFRDSFPSHWARRFEESQPQQTHQPHPDHTQPQPPQAAPAPAPASPQPQQSTAATQTETGPAPHLPQYGLRNTVDLGQKTVDPAVDADDRGQRSMSAPPDARPPPSMSANEHPEPQTQPQPQAGNVRHIPIFVEGRDEPVINKNVDHGAHFGETKPHHPSPPHHAPPQHHAPPHAERDYFADDGPAFHPPPNFSRAFGTPFNKGFRQGPQPFTQQKAYPQNAYRGASPQRSQSPKRPTQEEFVKTHHPQQQAPPPQQHQQQHHPQHQQQHHPQQHPQQQQPHPQQQPPPPQQPHAPSPPPRQQITPTDPITLILGIQTDVLNLMSEVENFAGAKNDKQYLFLDEMLTRNLIKLDNVETDGKENIRQARKEAIKCIQKCIAVLEAKADSNANANAKAAQAAEAAAPAQDVDMQQNAGGEQTNGEAELKENTKEEAKADTQEIKEEQKLQEPAKEEAKEIPPPDSRPEENRAVLVENKEQDKNKKSPKKKVVKKRDKSKDNKDSQEKKDEKLESMQVDEKGDQDSQKMEVDAAASQ